MERDPLDETRLQSLCAWACAVELADIPADVLQRAMLVMADDLACAIAGAGDAEARDGAGDTLAGARPSDGAGDAAVHGTRGRLPVPLAAASNAIHANWWQLDGGHYEFMCHAGLYCMPVALAEGEARGSTLGEVLRAFIIGYETTCALAALAPGRDDLHPHGEWSAAGGFATLAALRRLPAEALAHGLRQLAAATPRVPFAGMLRGDLSVNTLVGRGILQAFEAADGMPPWPPAPRARPPAPREWALRKGYHKLVACGGQAQPALEALLAARAGATGPLDAQVLRIDAHLHAFAGSMMDMQPATSLGARFSIPHVLAVAWVHGRTDATALGGEFLHDPLVARVRGTVAFSTYSSQRPPPFHRAARVEVHTAWGSSTGECLAPRGSPGQPLTLDDVRAKIADLAGPRLDRWLDAAGRLAAPFILDQPLSVLL